jgi:protein gp37
MGDNSKIEWTDATWNPIVGCKAVSAGCDHCYAARYASRNLSDTYRGLAEDGVFNGTVRCLPERLDQPLRWKKPRRIFVNSMSDLFHPSVPYDFICRVFAVMGETEDRHTYQILTKRPYRMRSTLIRPYLSFEENQANVIVDLPLSNVWLGTSIENDGYTFRAGPLRNTPAAVRFLSLEPLLGPLPSLDLTGIGWVIVGGESGPGARPMHVDWVRDIRDLCIAWSIPFLFKQWGEWRDGKRMGKHAAGRELDGRQWMEYPPSRGCNVESPEPS